MNKKQAQQHIGQRCQVWTSLNGEYEGELIEVKSTPGRPWRGVVRIDTVLAPAFFDDDPRQRHKKTKSIGDLIEAGATSIRLTNQCTRIATAPAQQPPQASKEAGNSGDHRPPAIA